MANIIQHKRSSTPGAIPLATGLNQGELGINIADGKLYTKNSGNAIINLGVTSISGTSITPASGNFNSLDVIGGSLTVSPLATSGSVISYTHPDYTELTNTDVIISGQLELTRASANGIYNLAVESSWSSSVSPLNTLWNNDGWSNLETFKTRTYSSLYSAVGGSLGNNLPNAELIMKHVPTDRYWKIKFSSWTQGGNGGGFEYTRQEIFSSGGESILNGDIQLNGLISELNTSKLFANGADLTYGGQSPDIVLKGYTWFGKVDGSVGIGAHHANVGSFGTSTLPFYLFEGFNENVTQYTAICLAAGYNPMLFLHTNLNIGIGTTEPAYKLDINGTANVATSLRINAATASTIASFDSSKNIVSLSTATYPNLTELSYVKGVTSALQTQLNAKQATLTNPVTGTGTTSYLPKFSATSTLANSLIYDNGTNIGIGTTSPSTKLHVNGFISQSAVHASAGLSTDQTITANSDTVIQLTDKDDPNNWWNASTYRFLPTVSGYYFIAAQVNWDPGAGTGQLNIQLRKNGTSFGLCQNAMITGVTLTQHVNGIVNLNGSTDYVELTGYTSTTNASQVVNGTADRAWTKLEAYKIS